MSQKEWMEEIERWKIRWSARLDAGFEGPILPHEEGSIYADAIVINGELRAIQ